MNDSKSLINVSDDLKIEYYASMPEKFKINHYTFGGVEMEDLVHSEAPYFHFQILRPGSEEQREKALAYFREHNKIYIAFMSAPEILLYLGCTESIYIRSKGVDFKEDQLRGILNEASLWFQEHKNDKGEDGKAYN